MGCRWDIIEKSSPVNATVGSRSWPVGSRKPSLGRQPGPWAGRCLSQDNLPATAAMGGAGFEAKLSSGSKVGGRWGWGHVGWLTKCNSQRQSRRKQVGVRRAGDWVRLPSGVRLALVAALTIPFVLTAQAAFERETSMPAVSLTAAQRGR